MTGFHVWLSPANLGFLMVCLGVLSIYAELVLPGRVVFLCLGAAFIAFGLRQFASCQPSARAITCLLLASLALLSELLFETHWAGACLGTVLLALGALSLFRDHAGVSLGPALAGSVVLGSTSAMLARSGRKARLNKRSDLDRVGQADLIAMTRRRR
jgi:membrane-bound ClpP family serine protease